MEARITESNDAKKGSERKKKKSDSGNSDRWGFRVLLPVIPSPQAS